MAPFSSSNYDIINIGSAEIINRSITAVDIALATIDISNLSASCIASLSGGGGGGGLTANSVNSSHIINGSILGIDISLGQIGEAHFDASFNTKLEVIGDAIKELQKPFGVIRIINQSLGEDNFDYDLYVYNAVTSEYDSLASAIRLKKANSFSHFYQVAGFETNMKLVVSGNSVGAFTINQGAEYVNDEDGELIFKIGSSSNYQNIEITVEVYI